MPASVTINPTHWANRGCIAWWANLPDQTQGTVWPDLLGRYPFTVSYVSGTVNRTNNAWSPSGGSAAGILGSADARPGAFTKGFLGPLYDGTAKWWATSSVPIIGTGGGSTTTQGGSLAFWHRPNVTNSTTYEIISVGTSTGLLWDFQVNTGGISAGFFAGSEFRAVASSNYAWDTTKWTHYVVTWAPNDKCRLYVNGILQATASASLGTPLTCPSGTFYLGNSSWNSNTYASPSAYDDMAIWNRQMSAMEVWNVYTQSMQGWPGRLDSLVPWVVPCFTGFNNFVVNPSGGIVNGGYPVRTSAWIMPGIGGIVDGGSKSPTLAFVPTASGGLTDGGDTAAPLAWDTFTGSSGTLLASHKSDDGGTWTKHPSYSSGDLRLDGSGALYANVAATAIYLQSYSHQSADYRVSLDIASGAGTVIAGACARWSNSANTGYLAYVSISSGSATVNLQSIVSGSTSNLGSSSSFSWSGTKRLTLSIVGSTINVYIDGIVKVGPITNTAISSTGFAGLFMSTASGTIDNWMSTDGGVQAQYVLSGSGGETFGGIAAAGRFYVLSCAGGVIFGTKIIPSLSCTMSAAGGMKEGGKAPAGLVFTATASGGFETGGTIPDGYVSFVTTGGLASGGQRTGPVMDYAPIVSGGIVDGGKAPNVAFYEIQPSGGLTVGGECVIVAALWYHVYANDGAGGPINYTTPIDTTLGLTYTTGTLTGPAVWLYAVRAYDANLHLEELNLDAMVTVRLDASGHDITNIPASPLTLVGHAAPGGAAILTWHYQRPIEPAQTPTQFRVYQGVGTVNYTTPVTTVAYQSRYPMTSVKITGLTGGTTYLFGVRASNTTGEEKNTTTVSVVAETTGPSTVINLTSSPTAA